MTEVRIIGEKEDSSESYLQATSLIVGTTGKALGAASAIFAILYAVGFVTWWGYLRALKCPWVLSSISTNSILSAAIAPCGWSLWYVLGAVISLNKRENISNRLNLLASRVSWMKHLIWILVPVSLALQYFQNSPDFMLVNVLSLGLLGLFMLWLVEIIVIHTEQKEAGWNGFTVSNVASLFFLGYFCLRMLGATEGAIDANPRTSKLPVVLRKEFDDKLDPVRLLHFDGEKLHGVKIRELPIKHVIIDPSEVVSIKNMEDIDLKSLYE